MGTKLPPGGILLHGAAEVEELKGDSTSAILLKLSDSVLQDVKKASQEKERLHFVTGATPVRPRPAAWTDYRLTQIRNCGSETGSLT